VASGGRTDLRTGEEKLPAAQAGADYARHAPWNRCRSQDRFAEDGLLWTIEHGFHRASESDGTSRSGSAGTPHLGYLPAGPTPAGSSRMVASLLSFCAPPCIVTSRALAVARARGQAGVTTLSTAYPSYGSGENTSTMDGSRGALLPIAAGFRLRSTEARCGWSVMSRGSR